MHLTRFLTDGTLSFLLADHLGSSSVTTDANGAKTASALYKAFGETRYTLGNLNTDYKFTGQREEASLGIYFFNARWYDSSLGRFLSPDSIVPTSTQGTQAWDRYAFVNNNPVRYTDPTGHGVEDNGTPPPPDNPCIKYGYNTPQCPQSPPTTSQPTSSATASPTSTVPPATGTSTPTAAFPTPTISMTPSPTPTIDPTAVAERGGVAPLTEPICVDYTGLNFPDLIIDGIGIFTGPFDVGLDFIQSGLKASDVVSNIDKTLSSVDYVKEPNLYNGSGVLTSLIPVYGDYLGILANVANAFTCVEYGFP